MNEDKIKREQLEEEVRGLKNVLEVAQSVVSSLDLDEVLQDILNHAMDFVGVPAGTIALYDKKTNRLTLHAHKGLSEAFVSHDRWSVKKGGLSHKMLQQGGLFIIDDTRDADFFNNPLAISEGIRSIICIPLILGKDIVGALYLDDFVPRNFSKQNLDTLEIFGSFAALSIKNAKLHAQTQQLAVTDGLTGLYNHRQFKEFFSRELSRARRHKKHLSVIMFDIDDFKKFNDTYGHPLGDRVLQIVAELLPQILRQGDILCRYGGEEFIAILPETCIDKAVAAAERVRSAVETDSIKMLNGQTQTGITVSIGVASYPADGDSVTDLLSSVDKLLYKAKGSGKNRVYSN